MSELARYLAGDNYLTRSASGIKRGLSALADSLVARSNEGTENMQAALSGVRVKPGAILTDAGYVMPDASGQADFSQVGLEREPDTMRVLELFGGAMTPAKGSAIAAKAGLGGKVAADVASQRAAAMETARQNAVKMLGLPEDNTAMDRARAMGFYKDAYHGTGFDEALEEFDPAKGRGARGGTGSWFAENPDIASSYAPNRGGSVYPVMLKTDDFADFYGNGKNWARLDPETPLNLPNGTQEIPSEYMGSVFDEFTDTNDLARLAKANKASGLTFENVQDVGPYRHGFGQNLDAKFYDDNYVVFDPRNIRSRFAAFDPARANEADLLASRANLGPIVNALLQGYDR